MSSCLLFQINLTSYMFKHIQLTLTFCDKKNIIIIDKRNFLFILHFCVSQVTVDILPNFDLFW